MEPKWLDIAQGELGVHEIAGREDNPRIVAYHAATDGGASPDEVPWCSSFVNWVMQQAGIAGTRSKAARSWMSWGRGLGEPELGCVVVLRRGTSSWQGHVGLYLGRRGESVLLLGGNQSNQVKVSSFQVEQVLGYRWPIAVE